MDTRNKRVVLVLLECYRKYSWVYKAFTHIDVWNTKEMYPLYMVMK